MENNDALPGQEDEAEVIQNTESQPEQAVAPEAPSMDALLETGLPVEFPRQGEIRSGTIATIRENEVMVSIGTKSEGVISGRELEQIPDEERAAFQIGLEIPVYVLATEDSSGNVVLSYLRAREEQDWEKAEELLEADENFTSEVIGYNKGGLIVPLGRLRGFVPASQIGLLRRSMTSGDTPDERYGDLVGESIKVRIIEVDRSRRRLILSERQALQETREALKERLLDDLNEGEVRTGRVTSLADFGAFVNIDGADGLVHLSEISWDRVQHPNEVLEVGEEVQVKVISIDRERKRIGLSIRQLQSDPWTEKISHLKEGMLVEGTVTHLTKFGAFARIGDELEGLIHVSELKEERVEHPKEVVKEGEELTLRIIKIDPERHRIGLSLRKVDSPAYADLDWKMALAGEIDGIQEGEPQIDAEEAMAEEAEDLQVEETTAQVEAEEPSETVDAEQVAEAPEMIEEQGGEGAEAEIEAEEAETADDDGESAVQGDIVEEVEAIPEADLNAEQPAAEA